MPSNSKQEKSCFPPISSRQKLSTSSNELEQSAESYREPDNNHESENNCESPMFKLPVIERTKSRSVTSIGSPCSTLGSRQFSRDKPSRRSLCRSPSCPSNLGLLRSESIDGTKRDSILENGVYDHFPQRNDDNDSNVKLPNIFRNATSLPLSPRHSPRHSTLSNTWQTDRENGYVYSLRRTDSSNDNTTENKKQEQQQTHALLLPLRNVDNVSKGKKKKKRLTKSNSTGSFMDGYDNSSPDKGNNLGRWSGFENEQNQINGSKECLIEGQATERSVEMVSARKMKKWMKQHPPKEGQVKA